MNNMRCGCGDEVIPGDLFTDADRAAWERKHATCGPAEPVLRAVTVRCRDAAEARELAPFLRAMGLVVGRTGAALFCKPRAATLRT